jgi:hypothetical protein
VSGFDEQTRLLRRLAQLPVKAEVDADHHDDHDRDSATRQELLREFVVSTPSLVDESYGTCAEILSYLQDVVPLSERKISMCGHERCGDCYHAGSPDVATEKSKRNVGKAVAVKDSDMTSSLHQGDTCNSGF